MVWQGVSNRLSVIMVSKSCLFLLCVKLEAKSQSRFKLGETKRLYSSLWLLQCSNPQLWWWWWWWWPIYATVEMKTTYVHINIIKNVHLLEKLFRNPLFCEKEKSRESNRGTKAISHKIKALLRLAADTEMVLMVCIISRAEEMTMMMSVISLYDLC